LLAEPPPLTVTLFVTVTGADADTFTASVMGGAEPGAEITALVVQVTTCAASLQLQPEPVALTNVRLGSSVSVTVITPELEAVPPLLTRIV
jgi:hypothetical protein